MKISMSSAMPGCVFEHYGRVPESVYVLPDTFESPLVEAVYKNDVQSFKKLVQDGQLVNMKLKIGEMGCIEYAAMLGYREILQALMDHSLNASVLQQYFALSDVVERAYMISKNKDMFFKQEALAEANRYEAALYTAIEYDQPRCVQLMLTYLNNKEPGKHLFNVNGSRKKTLGAMELAEIRGHKECYEILHTKMEAAN